MSKAATIRTGEGGSLKVKQLHIDGKRLTDGTYKSPQPWLKGTGTVTVDARGRNAPQLLLGRSAGRLNRQAVQDCGEIPRNPSPPAGRPPARPAQTGCRSGPRRHRGASRTTRLTLSAGLATWQAKSDRTSTSRRSVGSSCSSLADHDRVPSIRHTVSCLRPAVRPLKRTVAT